MRTNLAVKFTEKTHEGAPAACINAEQQLRRSVMACMLWESEFYEDGKSIAERIAELAKSLPFEKVAAIAVEAREKMKLRHAPLWIVASLLKAKRTGRAVGDLIARVIQRADEPAELLSMYWQDQPQAPLPKQLKLGLARSLAKFDEYQLAKYNRHEAVKLRDVLFLSHAKPTEDRVDLYKRIAEDKLVTPDTWEVSLSGGADKAETFRRLMAKNSLGGLAFLRNLRNMKQTGIAKKEIAGYGALENLKRVLPFRFIAAARAVPQWEDVIEPMMLKVLEGKPKLQGKTVLLVDVSGSMNEALSKKSDMERTDAAYGLAVLLRELCEDVAIFSFSNILAQIAPRRGFALRDAIHASQRHNGTYLAGALNALHTTVKAEYDRIIVITDEQSHDGIIQPNGKGYVINVASNKNGVGYGQWTHIDGWSEAVIDYIQVLEGWQGTPDN